MNVFLDTEFTDFRDPKLIILGMASEYGEDFNAETPFPDNACSAFVREVVAVSYTHLTLPTSDLV